MRKPLLLLILVAMLTACGLKGPLYLPNPAAAPPAAATTPGKQADEKKNPESK